MHESEEKFISQNLEIFCCPKCGGSLTYKNNFECSSCGQKFLQQDDIPLMFWQNEWDTGKKDVTEVIKSFYEENPFPSYDDFDNASSLIDKARKSLFAKLLDDQIPYGSKILECGCGTGQMTNFLSMANRNAFGIDLCINSLKLAQDFKIKNNLERAHFYQMNLFRPIFKPESFDLVISNGVLHHTSDPYLAFKSVASLVKPNGYILIGLYHKYGRLITDIRRLIFNLTNNKLKFLDSRATSNKINPVKRKIWFNDQYKNPHESKHTIGEVLNWLKDTNFTFVNSIPATILFNKLDETDMLFKQHKLGNQLRRLFVNLGMIVNGYKEGGLFIVIGKKK